MLVRALRILPALLGISSLGACASPGVCTAADLSAALASAAPSSTVDVGACTIEGSFVVPASVSVRGAGPASVLVNASGGGAVLDISAGQSHVDSLTLRTTNGSSALRSVHASQLAVTGVDVDVVRGAGIGVSGGSLTLDDVTLHGPITHESAATASSDPTMTGVWGVIADGASVQFGTVHLAGFSVGAVAIEGGSLTWTDTNDAIDIESSRGTGIVSFGGAVTLHGVEIGDTLSGLGVAGMAIASVMGAHDSAPSLTIDGATISAGAGYGIVAFDTALQLDHLSVDGVGLVGLQAQRGSVDATNVSVHGAGGAGIALLDVTSIRITHTTLSSQRMVSLPTDLGSAMFGDGIHVRRTSSTSSPVNLVVTDASLDDNPRAGFLLDGDSDAPATLTLTDVRAGATSTSALGVVAQNTIVPSGWDSGVVRMGTPVTNDPMFSTTIDVVGLLMPPTSLPPAL